MFCSLKKSVLLLQITNKINQTVSLELTVKNKQYIVLYIFFCLLAQLFKLSLKKSSIYCYHPIRSLSSQSLIKLNQVLLTELNNPCYDFTENNTFLIVFNCIYVHYNITQCFYWQK